MEHGVAGKHVGVCFGASLSVDVVADVAELMEQVEAVEHYHPFASRDGIADPCVPYYVGGVERRIGISPACVGGEVGG